MSLRVGRGLLLGPGTVESAVDRTSFLDLLGKALSASSVMVCAQAVPLPPRPPTHTLLAEDAFAISRRGTNAALLARPSLMHETSPLPLISRVCIGRLCHQVELLRAAGAADGISLPNTTLVSHAPDDPPCRLPCISSKSRLGYSAVFCLHGLMDLHDGLLASCSCELIDT